MTKEQILKDTELIKRASELFGAKPYKHRGQQSVKEMAVSKYHCGKCGENQFSDLEPCTHPDPINLGNGWAALQVFRGLLKKDKEAVRKAMIKVCPDEYMNCRPWDCGMYALMWFAEYATSRKIWELCCLAKEGSK
jgi:hypothetical protein